MTTCRRQSSHAMEPCRVAPTVEGVQWRRVASRRLPNAQTRVERPWRAVFVGIRQQTLVDFGLERVVACVLSGDSEATK